LDQQSCGAYQPRRPYNSRSLRIPQDHSCQVPVAERSKGAKILELIGRPKGATLAEIVKATDWQKHSIRGFLSTAAKKHGLKIESTKSEAGDRVYQIRK
jgi:hypothetical protein